MYISVFEIHTLPPCAVSVCGLLCTRVPGVAPLVHSQINHFFAKIYYATRRTAAVSAVLLIYLRAPVQYTICAQGCGVSAGYCGYAWTLEGATSVKPRTVRDLRRTGYYN